MMRFSEPDPAGFEEKINNARVLLSFKIRLSINFTIHSQLLLTIHCFSLRSAPGAAKPPFPLWFKSF
jgi:hypothetical protein